ncbi:MAG: hypothetical protein ACYC09_11240 [Bacteroidota bacterium]
MELLEYFSLDSSDESNISPIFTFVKSNCDKWYDNIFSIDNYPTMEGVLDKYLHMASFYEFQGKSKLLKTAQTLFKSIKPSFHGEIGKSAADKNEKIYLQLSSILIKIFIEIQNSLNTSQKSSVFSRLYIPQFSNKQKALELIQDAINVINADEHLPSKLKSALISHLTSCLELLKLENTNWKSFWGSIKESLLILGAIGSIASGIQGVQSIIEAKSKIEQASQVIETTSINYNIHYNTFAKQIDTHKTPKLLVKKK